MEFGVAGVVGAALVECRGNHVAGAGADDAAQGWVRVGGLTEAYADVVLAAALAYLLPE
ncbi:hypothetical protein [Nocardia harenae]|uniref:hypothetical protein n=1 Tax=Nocardia harenae TaxID=358707 RepID=UPI000AF04B8A|nr:hypothetical protein [Nocardia harenae]